MPLLPRLNMKYYGLWGLDCELRDVMQSLLSLPHAAHLSYLGCLPVKKPTNMVVLPIDNARSVIKS